MKRKLYLLALLDWCVYRLQWEANLMNIDALEGAIAEIKKELKGL
jgi:hypothetical protein